MAGNGAASLLQKRPGKESEVGQANTSVAHSPRQQQLSRDPSFQRHRGAYFVSELLYVSLGSSNVVSHRTPTVHPTLHPFLSRVQECLKVAMIPESFLAAGARARSRAANVSAEFAGIGAGVGGSSERRDSMSQEVSEKRCYSYRVSILVPI